MIHTLFTLERPLIVFDTETTGVDTNNDRIIELAFQLFTADGLQKEWKGLFNPEIPIPADASRTHGIFDVDVVGKPRFKDLAKNIAFGFSNCDFAGKNIRFDLRITKSEMDRAEVPWSYAGARIIDADRLEQLGEPRDLSTLYKKHTGKDLVDAHSALADVTASVEVIVAQLQKYTQLPRVLDRLHTLQWPGLIDTEGKFRVRNGVVVCTFGKYRDQPITTIDPSYWRGFILNPKNSFSQEIKDIAANALKGIYPKV